MKAAYRYLGLLAVALLAGCGQSTPESSPEMRLESPAIRADGVISSRYLCGGGSIWMPLRWKSVPPETKELVVYLGRFSRDGKAGSPQIEVPFGIWITQIDPSTRGIPTNTLPPDSGAVTYRMFNSCPPRKGQSILLKLFALQRPLHPPARPASNSAVELTEAALGIDRFAATSKWVEDLTEQALASDQIVATYGRR